MKFVTTLKLRLDDEEYRKLKEAIKVLSKIELEVLWVSEKIKDDSILSINEENKILDYLQGIYKDSINMQVELSYFMENYSDNSCNF